MRVMKNKTTVKMEKSKRLEKINKGLSMAIIAAAVVFVITLVPYFLPTGNKIVVAQQISSESFEALLKGGIDSSNTVEIGNTVKVSYQLPQNLLKENADMYILGALSSLAPSREKIIITAYSGESKLGAIEVKMSDILSYKNKAISIEEFKLRFKES